MLIATLLGSAAADFAAAQTSPSAPPKFQSDSFATPDNSKTAPAKKDKSCERYGPDFVAVPGTDTCIKTRAGIEFQTGVRR